LKSSHRTDTSQSKPNSLVKVGPSQRRGKLNGN